MRTGIAGGAALLAVLPVAWLATHGSGSPAVVATPAAVTARPSVAPTAAPTTSPEPTPETPAQGEPSLPPAAAPAAPQRLDERPVTPAAPASSSGSSTTGASDGPRASGPAAGSPAAPAQGCSAPTGAISPTRFQVSRMGVNVPMITVGKDRAGNPGTAPESQLYTAAWYNGSPAPGTSAGNVIVNIHTYQGGSALGNDLNGANGLRPGDVIRVVGSDGRTVCYRYREKKTIKVATYDPKSGVYINPSGRPQLAILICWDKNARTGEYDSRILFYADLMA